MQNKILNIHPSLLPAFKGLNAQKQAIDYGAKVSGCTVHFVDEKLDHGPIIMQKAVPVFDTDTYQTLSERILKEEHTMYSQAIQRVIENQFFIKDRCVSLKESNNESIN